MASFTYPLIFFLASSRFSSKSSFSCSTESLFGFDDFGLLNCTRRPSPSESECGSLWPARCETSGSSDSSSPMACTILFCGDGIGVPVAVDDGLVVIDVSNDCVLDDSFESLRFIIGLVGAALGYG